MDAPAVHESSLPRLDAGISPPTLAGLAALRPLRTIATEALAPPPLIGQRVLPAGQAATPLGARDAAGLAEFVMARLPAHRDGPLHAVPPAAVSNVPHALPSVSMVFVRPLRRSTLAPPPEPARRPQADPRGLARAVQEDPSLPLPETVRSEFAPMIGSDLRGVRLHTGDVAATTASALGADAFTLGRDIFFGQGKYDLRTPQGRALLAHELTHVRQQASGNRRLQMNDGPSGPAEAEAIAIERAVRDAATGRPGSRLLVGAYRRLYTSTSGGRLTPQERARLDRISIRALALAEELLASQIDRLGPQELATVRAEVQLDPARLSDEEAANLWARALADAIRARLGGTS